MAIATSTAIALALSAAAAGTSYYNKQKTAKNTDNALADSIRNQAGKQKQADAKVNAEVEALKGSRAEDSRAKSLDGYMDTLRKSRGKLESGLTPNIGSDTFQADAAGAAGDVRDFAGDRAGLMARIDAPTMQRQGEAFGYGNLGTDLNLIGREADGQNFLDQLRVKRASQRNAKLDFAAGLMQAGAGAAGGMGSGASAGASPFTAQGGANAAGYGAFSGANLTTPGYFNRAYPWLQRAGG